MKNIYRYGDHWVVPYKGGNFVLVKEGGTFCVRSKIPGNIDLKGERAVGQVMLDGRPQVWLDEAHCLHNGLLRTYDVQKKKWVDVVDLDKVEIHDLVHLERPLHGHFTSFDFSCTWSSPGRLPSKFISGGVMYHLRPYNLETEGPGVLRFRTHGLEGRMETDKMTGTLKPEIV